MLAHRVPKKYPSCARSQDVEDTTSSIALANVGCKPESDSPIRSATPGSDQYIRRVDHVFSDDLTRWRVNSGDATHVRSKLPMMSR